VSQKKQNDDMFSAVRRLLMNTSNQGWQATKPFNQIPALPPAIELETRTVLKHCIEARTALGELKQAAELIPNQTMLINTIPLLEAKDSSEIEYCHNHRSAFSARPVQ
jgi:hypothetical protein